MGLSMRIAPKRGSETSGFRTVRFSRICGFVVNEEEKLMVCTLAWKDDDATADAAAATLSKDDRGWLETRKITLAEGNSSAHRRGHVAKGESFASAQKFVFPLQHCVVSTKEQIALPEEKNAVAFSSNHASGEKLLTHRVGQITD